jgi:hypothetical protein
MLINRRPRTLPETERTDSTENKISILGVDSGTHTIYAKVNGYKITAVCREKSDPEICGRIKDILLSSALEKLA